MRFAIGVFDILLLNSVFDFRHSILDVRYLIFHIRYSVFVDCCFLYSIFYILYTPYPIFVLYFLCFIFYIQNPILKSIVDLWNGIFEFYKRSWNFLFDIGYSTSLHWKTKTVTRGEEAGGGGVGRRGEEEGWKRQHPKKHAFDGITRKNRCIFR